MDAVRWKQIDELVDAALELPVEKRREFVTERSGNDSDLRTAVLDLLLANDEASGDFLSHSAMRVAAKAAADNEDIHTSAFAFINKTIATYRVEKMLGIGGMGEVYLAFDEKLKRQVALKLLPAEYISNDERVKRFEVEARAIAKLNHPGIVTVFDVGNFEGVNYIATEYVEGRTLRDLIGGRFKMRNIILNSIQICDALAAAHKEGIIHRDIKPENVMIRKDGYAKILDFGLAKLTDVAGHTIRDFSATSKGVIIGTPAYMSPAQISDESVDHRTDLWSAGVVLYEFLTGKNPFKGKNRQATFQAVLSKEIRPPSALNPDVPPELDAVLLKLLEKDRENGYQSAAQLRADLKRILREHDSSGSWTRSGEAAAPAEKNSRLVYAAIAALLLIAVAASGGAYYYFRDPPQRSDAIDWKNAKSEPVTEQPGIEYFPSLSPDGKTIVYAAQENGIFHIFSQRVGSKKRENLTSTSDADNTQPAFSPDGEQIAFRSEREPRGIYLMNTEGENLRRLSEVGYHPSWSPNGKEIVVASFGRDQPTTRANPGSTLSVIDVATSEKREIAAIEASFPAWSPGGHRIAYWFYTGTFGRRDIATIPANGGEPVVIAKDFAVSNWNPVWSPDGNYLYFVSSKAGNMNFWRVRIDEKTGEQLSDPEAVVTPSKYSRHLSFSRDGKRLVYVQTNDTANIQGVEFDPTAGKTKGDPVWITQGDRAVSRAELSADGSQFIMRLIRRTQDDIVSVSRDGRTWRDVTNDEPFDRYVRWSPDGKRIAFTSDRNRGGQVWVGNADGTELRQVTFYESEDVAAGFPVWAPDGRRLSVFFNGRTYIIDPELERPDTSAELLPENPGRRFVGWDWSPDGKMLLGTIPADGGEKRFIGYYSFETKTYYPVVESMDGIGSWLPDSRRFVFSEGARIFLADIVTKQKREIYANPQVDIRSPFVSRDGGLLYYVAANNESDIWMLDIASEK
jgi:serine/threonine protein kinase